MENHSHIDFSKIHRPIIGSHMIRNPCGIINSAYEYHKITDELIKLQEFLSLEMK